MPFAPFSYRLLVTVNTVQCISVSTFVIATFNRAPQLVQEKRLSNCTLNAISLLRVIVKVTAMLVANLLCFCYPILGCCMAFFAMRPFQHIVQCSDVLGFYSGLNELGYVTSPATITEHRKLFDHVMLIGSDNRSQS